MFTLQEIKTAHAKVKSGADFPAYIKELKTLGLQSYHFFVSDGHTDYSGIDNFSISSDAKYAALHIADSSSIQTLQTDVKNHQKGQTDFLTFCRQAAEAGVEKWTVDLVKMTCVYYDKEGNDMLVENIPGVQ